MRFFCCLLKHYQKIASVYYNRPVHWFYRVQLTCCLFICLFLLLSRAQDTFLGFHSVVFKVEALLGFRLALDFCPLYQTTTMKIPFLSPALALFSPATHLNVFECYLAFQHLACDNVSPIHGADCNFCHFFLVSIFRQFYDFSQNIWAIACESHLCISIVFHIRMNGEHNGA